MRAVVKKIVIDEEENVSYKPTKVVNAAKTYTTSQISADSETNEGVLNDKIGMQKGEVSNFSLLVDPSGLFSKLPRQVTRMYKVHRAIRAGKPNRTVAPRADAKQRIDVSEAALLAAEARYLEGATLREAARPLGISHMRLASLLKKRGVRIRSCSPTLEEVDEMVHRYDQGESLARIGTKLGYQPNTVRTHLLARGVSIRSASGFPTPRS